MGGATVEDEIKISTFDAIYVEHGVYFIENETIYVNFMLHKIPDRMIGDRHCREREYDRRVSSSRSGRRSGYGANGGFRLGRKRRLKRAA